MPEGRARRRSQPPPGRGDPPLRPVPAAHRGEGMGTRVRTAAVWVSRFPLRVRSGPRPMGPQRAPPATAVPQPDGRAVAGLSGSRPSGGGEGARVREASLGPCRRRDTLLEGTPPVPARAAAPLSTGRPGRRDRPDLLPTPLALGPLLRKRGFGEPSPRAAGQPSGRAEQALHRRRVLGAGAPVGCGGRFREACFHPFAVFPSPGGDQFDGFSLTLSATLPGW